MNVIQSTKDKTRIIVETPEGFKFVLVSKGKVNGKQLFIPVTVLAPHMIILNWNDNLI